MTPLGSPTKRNGLLWWLSGKESTCNAGDTGDLGSVPASGRFPLEKGIRTHSNILAWRIPCTEARRATVHEGDKEADTIEVMEHTHTHQGNNHIQLE